MLSALLLVRRYQSNQLHSLDCIPLPPIEPCITLYMDPSTLNLTLKTHLQPMKCLSKSEPSSRLLTRDKQDTIEGNQHVKEARLIYQFKPTLFLTIRAIKIALLHEEC